MPRARNIKHSFFENDSLAEIDPVGRLLFIGLWTIADFKGDLEYRAKKIKAQILPYDDCDIDEIVINLDLSGFITTYNVDGVSYIHINKFTKHQNPHPNERKKGSEIPAYDLECSQAIDLKGVAINPDSIDKNKCEPLSDRADSLSLIPNIPIPKEKKKKFSPPTEQQLTEFLISLNWPADNGATARAMIDYYAQQGWKLSNGNMMKDWNAAARGWLRNQQKWDAKK
ncbi:MAG: hypothetical protein Unbinned3818contig1000_15 [Prokaryotic dsDNA virus sp.]|nr:hypothetical protein [Phycisphaerae bacterium]QDP45944.1 MAG: hypothetical protein Unbinned3818contig1000_15 [Prokaryotic dsDNA virus sp.]|tara:strand:+ start:5274 stop:5954 length:681 start_codon:yes stop_codon:yes gene_type:complete